MSVPLAQHHLEVFALANLIGVQRVEDGEQVQCPQVEGVVVEGDFQIAAAFLLLAEPQQIVAKQSVAAPVFRVSLQGGAGMFHRLGEAVVAADYLGHIREEGRVGGGEGGAERLHLPAVFLIVRVVAVKQGVGGQDAEGGEGLRVQFKGAVELIQRLLPPFLIQQHLAEYLQGRHGVRVDRQGAVSRPLLTQHPRQTHQGRHIAAVDGQRLAVASFRIGGVVFLQEQVGPQGVGLEVLRVGSGGLVEEGVGAVEIPQQLACQSHHGDILGTEGEAVVVAGEGRVQVNGGGGFMAFELKQAAVLHEGAQGRFEVVVHHRRQNTQGGVRLACCEFNLGQLSADVGMFGVVEGGVIDRGIGGDIGRDIEVAFGAGKVGW